MSRIIAGVAGGRKLDSVAGQDTRPTTDRVKEALFSRLDSWDVLTDARVLDLFAGSGALGVESLSRGARSAVLVDHARSAVTALRSNAKLINSVLGLGSARQGTSNAGARVEQAKAATFLANYAGPSFTLVFLDPPYPMSSEDVDAILTTLVPHLDHDAVVCLERASSSPAPQWPEGLSALKPRRYGETTLHFAETPIGETPIAETPVTEAPADETPTP